MVRTRTRGRPLQHQQCPLVRVKYLKTDSLPQATLDAYAASLNDEERHRASQQSIPRDYVAAHGLKREMLALCLQRPPAALAFTRQAGGKPVLLDPGEADLRFNLSHTRGLVACAVAQGIEVGIDVETLERRVPLKIARRFFAPDEALWGEAQGDHSFLSLWTLKEAVVKAHGRGLGVGLHTFSVRPDPPRMVWQDGLLPEGARCVLRQWCVGQTGIVALAAVLGTAAPKPPPGEAGPPRTPPSV